MKRYDLAILGGGTGGLVSAFVAAGMGARVVLVERERTGGDCLWTGCVPSKSLLAAAHLAHRMRHADRVGLPATAPAIDFAQVMARVHAAMATIAPHDSPERLRGAGVEVVHGEGAFTGPDTLQVAGRELRFRRAILATGSAPVVPALDGIDGADVLTTDTVWDLRERPERLVVLGGSTTGCELGQAFARLGSQVTIVESADRLVAREEPAASALLAEQLDEDGVAVRTRTRATAATGGQLSVSGPDGEHEIAFDRLLVAVGRRPRTAGIGLEAAGVEVDDGGAAVVDDRLRTSSPRILAVGDVTARLPLTHVAAHHARVATVNALIGTRRGVDDILPRATFTDPEIARVGITEAEARQRWNARATIARSDYATLDRAVTDGTPRGFALLIGDPNRRLVGATVAGPGAGEAIAELTAHLRAGNRIDAVSTTVHAYPTLAEGPSRAADDLLRRHYARPPFPMLIRALLTVQSLRDGIGGSLTRTPGSR